MIKVSVVVPVYNPGRFIEPGIESVLNQTLPADEYEVVYVDDGSTDETPARLDALAAAHANIRVIHTPNSGWPGRPRNIGIQVANGEYIQFLDQDDALTPDALRRLYEMAASNSSDIVIGKVASNFRPVPQHLFRRNIDACTIRDAPLISSLTPHKLFRTAFLRENAIEYPEGRRRLEDQLFMVRAYFAARTVSVLADTVCYLYARRTDGGNAGSGYAEPALYFGNLREILEVIVANTEPGEFRTRLLSRFYKTGMIDRLSEPFLITRPEARRQELYREIRSLAGDFIDDDVHATLGTFRRLRSTLLRADQEAALVTLATRLRDLRASAVLQEFSWDRGRLRVRFGASLVFGADGRPFEVLRRREETLIDPALLEGVWHEPVLIDEPTPWGRLECSIRERSTGTEWRVPTNVRVRLERLAGDDDAARLHPVFTAAATIDVGRIAGGRRIDPGDWELRARVFGPGIDRRTGVAPPGSVAPLPGVMMPRDGTMVAMASVEPGGLTLVVGSGLAESEGEAHPAASGAGDRAIRLPIPGAPAMSPGEVEVTARHRRSTVRLVGRLARSSGGETLTVAVDPLVGTIGTWQLSARAGEPGRPEVAVGTLEVVELDQGRTGSSGPRARARRAARRLARVGWRIRSAVVRRMS